MLWYYNDSKSCHLHDKRYGIDSLIEVCYLFTSCYGNDHMIDPSIIAADSFDYWPIASNSFLSPISFSF